MTGSHLKIPGDLESCVNSLGANQFYFDLKNNKTYNNKNMSVIINENNKGFWLNFNYI